MANTSTQDSRSPTPRDRQPKNDTPPPRGARSDGRNDRTNGSLKDDLGHGRASVLGGEVQFISEGSPHTGGANVGPTQRQRQRDDAEVASAKAQGGGLRPHCEAAAANAKFGALSTKF